MKGYEEIRTLIYEQLTKVNAHLPGIGRNKFSKDLARQIHALLEDDLQEKQEAVQAYPADVEKLVARLESGLKFNLFPRTAETRGIYEWILEQEKQGYSLDRFISWALHPDRVKYAGKYRAKPMYLKADYPQAFIGIASEGKITRNADGSLYV